MVYNKPYYTILMKNILKFGLIVTVILFSTIACNDETDGPQPIDTFSAISGTDTYSAPVNTSVTVTVNVRAKGLTALSANGNAISFTDDLEQTVSYDFAIPQNATVGQEFTVKFIASTTDQTDEFDVTVKAAGQTSEVPVFLQLASEFSDVKITNLLTSQDVLNASPDFVYGSMADGAGLLANADGSFTLINNIEADFSVARILLDENLKPFSGEYILNSVATGGTAQCSGSLISMEEHGFGPVYLSGGEWTQTPDTYSPGVYRLDPFGSIANASTPDRITSMGEWVTENAVAIGQNAYSDKTVVFIGDDNSDNSVPQGQLGMYVGNKGDLNGGKLYGLKVTSEGIDWEVDMVEGTEYNAEFVELTERDLVPLNTECLDKGVMGFSRLEDIDWRRGSAANEREIYFAVTGRERESLAGRGTFAGRIYRVVLNENDPTGAAKITCILDGDKVGGIAEGFHSPDNILVTENYAYIQEDPNGNTGKTGFAKLYQYNLNTGELKTVLECDQTAAASAGFGPDNSIWELTGMIDVSDVTGRDNTFILITQNHGWEPADGSAFTDPTAVSDVANSRKEGSMLFLVEGLGR